MRAVLSRLRPSWVRGSGGTDPFVALVIQQRLSRLATELRALDDPANRRFGSWHHVLAAEEAYERTLDDACRLAGLEVQVGRGAAHRLVAEASLEAAGWRW